MQDKVGKVWTVLDGQAKYYLKQKANLEKAINENELLQYLNSNGISAPVPVVDLNGESVSKIDGQYYCLYPHIEGKSIVDRKEIEKSGYTFGKAIGQLHKSLAGFNPNSNLKRMNMVSDLQNWILPTLEKHKTDLQYPSFTGKIAEIMDGLTKIGDLPVQAIHRDPHSNHFLFQDKKFVGFIDFEISVIGPRIFDLCYFSTSIIVDYQNGVVNKKEWLKLLEDLYVGYVEVNPLSTAEKESLFYMLCMITLVFMAFWCSEKQFQNARINENVLYWLVENKDIISNVIGNKNA